jgi:hypothetical protein
MLLRNAERGGRGGGGEGGVSFQMSQAIQEKRKMRGGRVGGGATEHDQQQRAPGLYSTHPHPTPLARTHTRTHHHPSHAAVPDLRWSCWTGPIGRMDWRPMRSPCVYVCVCVCVGGGGCKGEGQPNRISSVHQGYTQSTPVPPRSHARTHAHTPAMQQCQTYAGLNPSERKRVGSKCRHVREQNKSPQQQMSAPARCASPRVCSR